MSRLADKLAEVEIRPQSLNPGDYYLICPQCSANRKRGNQRKTCLSVKIDSEGGAVWKCHNCEWSGNVAGDSGYRPQQRASEQRETKPAKQRGKTDYRPKGLLRFFEKRKISVEIVEALGIFLCHEWMPQTEQEEPCITFPYRVDGVVTNHKYRDTNKNFRQDKDAKRSLFNRDSLKDQSYGVFVEGEIDVASILEAMGEDTPCVSLPDGAPSKHVDEIDPDEKRYWALKEASALLAKLDYIVLAGDGDGPGQALHYQLAHRLGPARCRVVAWPAGCKDANETLMKHGADMVKRCVLAATGYPLKGLKKPDAGDMEAFLTQSEEAKYAIGIKEIDEQIMFRPRQLVVVTGYPGDGKSSFMDFVAMSLARRYGWRWALFSPEHETEEHAARLMEQYKMMPFFEYSPNHKPMDKTDREDGLAWVRAHFTWILSESEDNPPSVDYVFERAREAWIRDHIKGIIIDPYNELSHDRGSDPEHEYVGKFLRRCIKFARHHDLMVVIIAHPAKPSPDKKKLQTHKAFGGPNLYDISGSANWFNKAMTGLSVYRPTENGPEVDVFVGKCKRKDQGRRGLLTLKWDTYTSRYEPRIPEEPGGRTA